MPTLLTSGLFIEHLAHAVQNYRITRRGLRNMALQLKGLRANVDGLRKDIEDMNSLAAGGREEAAVLKSHLGDIKSEISTHVSDIEFTANVLGNSGGSLDSQPKPVVTQTPAPTVVQPDPPKPAPVVAAAVPPAVPGKPLDGGFHGTFEEGGTVR